MKIDPRLHAQVDEHPYPLLFATISGAHLYGFPSADSDFDLRGVHLLPLNKVVGLQTGEETIDCTSMREGMEIDLVTHDVKKFFQLMLKKNGYVLEQLLSPLVVATSLEHEELKETARLCITKHHAHHYLGFSATQWKLFQNEDPPRVKPLLYVYRVLLTGIYLMRTGELNANLLQLNEVFGLEYLAELIQRKVNGAEKETLDAADMVFYRGEFERLTRELEDAYENSALPEQATASERLHDLLVRLRLQQRDLN